MKIIDGTRAWTNPKGDRKGMWVNGWIVGKCLQKMCKKTWKGQKSGVKSNYWPNRFWHSYLRIVVFLVHALKIVNNIVIVVPNVIFLHINVCETI
jgi:hypothetical protein